MKFLQTLVYMALTGWIPIMIISILLYWPASLKFISNTVMYILMMSIGIVGSYLWFVICLLEGYPWWMMAVLFALCCTWTSLFAVKETDKRCPKCKIMGWLDKIKIKAHKSYNEKTRAWETTYIGTFTNNIDGTIITRTYWPDDDTVLSESSREGVIGQTKTSVFRHDLVEKEYKVRNTTHIYQCKKCGHTFDKTEQDRHLISRTVLDSNTSRNSSTTYFYERDPKKS